MSEHDFPCIIASISCSWLCSSKICWTKGSNNLIIYWWWLALSQSVVFLLDVLIIPLEHKQTLQICNCNSYNKRDTSLQYLRLTYWGYHCLMHLKQYNFWHFVQGTNSSLSFFIHWWHALEFCSLTIMLFNFLALLLDFALK